MYQSIPTSPTSRPALLGTSAWSVYVPSSAQANPREGPTIRSTVSLSSAGTQTGWRLIGIGPEPPPAVTPEICASPGYSGSPPPPAGDFASMNAATAAVDNQIRFGSSVE